MLRERAGSPARRPPLERAEWRAHGLPQSAGCRRRRGAPMSLSGRHVIAGIGHTAFGKLPGSDTVALNVEACRLALADAGIDKSVVDAVFVKVPSSAHQFMFGQKVAEALGIAPRIGGG